MFAQRSMRRLPRLLVAAAAAVLAVGVAVPSAAPRATAVLPYEDSSRPVSERVADLLSRMTLEEKVGQMTQAERGAVTDDPSRITAWMLGSVLSGGGSTPTPNTPGGVGRHGRSLPAGGAEHAPGHPAALRRRLGARPRQPARRDGVPAQHRARRHARPRPRPQVEHITAIETRASGPQWTLRALHLRGA